MYNNKKCAKYFKQKPVYQRCLTELRKKWENYGKVTGRIVLKEASEEEKRAIGGIVGKIFFETDINFTFIEFEQGLQKTNFAPIDIKEVLEAYFGEPILTRQEKKSLVKNEKEIFLNQIYEELQQKTCASSNVLVWFLALMQEKKYGYQLLIKDFGKDSEKAATLARNTGMALFRLEEMTEEESYPLAVFSAEISGNPHFFDRGTTASQLLLHGICFWKKQKIPVTAYEWRETLNRVGILSDNIASIVHALGIHIETKEGLHPGYEAFCQRKEPYVITSENLKYVTGVKAADNHVYIVENEMVFLYLAENIKDRECALLCTSGQLRVAAFQLISLLIENNAVIYYSGDLDPEGMGIADRLWQKYGDVVQMWRMSPKDYFFSISEEELSEQRLAKLENIKHPLLKQTSEHMFTQRRAGYQENILEKMLADLRS